MNIKHLTFIVLIILQGCGNDDLDPGDIVQDSNLVFLKNENLYDQLIDDSMGTDYRLVDLDVLDDEIRISVQYAGGCRKHDFQLVWNGKNKVGDTDIAELALLHNGNGDNCEALVTETISFDIESISDFKNTIEENRTLRLINASNDERMVIYEGLPAFHEGSICTISVVAEDVVCGDGIFDNRWLKFAEDSAGLPIYFQPTEIDIAGFTSDLAEGEYIVGVNLSGPYVSDPDKIICLAYPGPSIPVTLLCIDEK